MTECSQSTFYRLAEPCPWSLHLFSKCDKYFIHQVKASIQNLRLPIADAASFVQQKFFYDYKESLSVPLMTIAVTSSGNIVSITITF